MSRTIEAPSSAPRVLACSTCGTAFSCGAGGGPDGSCWCMALPPLGTLSANADCLCPTCLRTAIAAAPTDGKP